MCHPTIPVAAPCGVVGGVDVKRAKQKKGISGGKATAAVLTVGISMLGTGLSRKEAVSQAKCKKLLRHLDHGLTCVRLVW
ncbi:MAG: hypothetical protein QOI44_209 [Actinomycetota bacterium]|nr:hypothetical protein [Actinomycetota bacterium]